MMFKDPEEVVDWMYDLFTQHKGSLGLAYVSYGDEALLPEYPALQVTAGPFTREIVGTHKFGLVFNSEMWLYHANLSQSHRERTRTDMQLVSSVKDLLDEHPTLGIDVDNNPNIIFGFIDSETPGIMNRAISGKSTAVVTTRITWRGEGRQIF